MFHGRATIQAVEASIYAAGYPTAMTAAWVVGELQGAQKLNESLYANKPLTVAGFLATSRRGHCDPDVRGKSAGLKMLA